MNNIPRFKVDEAIRSERVYQEQKWPNHQHTVEGWILILEKCLNDAKRAWVSTKGDEAAMHEIRQVTAVGFAAMEQCGALPRDMPKTVESNTKPPGFVSGESAIEKPK